MHGDVLVPEAPSCPSRAAPRLRRSRRRAWARPRPCRAPGGEWCLGGRVESTVKRGAKTSTMHRTETLTCVMVNSPNPSIGRLNMVWGSGGIPSECPPVRHAVLCTVVGAVVPWPCVFTPVKPQPENRTCVYICSCNFCNLWDPVVLFFCEDLPISEDPPPPTALRKKMQNYHLNRDVTFHGLLPREITCAFTIYKIHENHHLIEMYWIPELHGFRKCPTIRFTMFCEWPVLRNWCMVPCPFDCIYPGAIITNIMIWGFRPFKPNRKH